MHFTTERLERLQRSLELALNQEWPQLSATQLRLAKLRPSPIPIRRASAKRMSVVATVATDGGENKLSLEPIQLQVIRVADNLGEVYFEDFVAQSLKPEEILRFFFQSNQRLQKFLAYLQLDWGELLPHSDFQRSQLLSMLRELMEWAALMKLASQPPVKLLIRDGLLRSVLLTDAVFQRLREKFEALTAKHGHLLVGVANDIVVPANPPAPTYVYSTPQASPAAPVAAQGGTAQGDGNLPRASTAPAPQSAVTVVAPAPPPPVQVEVVPVTPGPDYVWAPGYWGWNGGAWVWLGGRWVVRPAVGAVWVGGRWARHGRGYVWFRGHWR